MSLLLTWITGAELSLAFLDLIYIRILFTIDGPLRAMWAAALGDFSDSRCLTQKTDFCRLVLCSVND